jgi:hypothetical protein
MRARISPAVTVLACAIAGAARTVAVPDANTVLRLSDPIAILFPALPQANTRRIPKVRIWRFNSS